MADHSNSTHASPPGYDARHARAFRDLEGALGDLRRMAALMEMAAEETVFQVEGWLGKHLRDRSNLQGYRIHVLTEDQSDSLDYAIRHTSDLIRALYRDYYAKFEGAPA